MPWVWLIHEILSKEYSSGKIDIREIQSMVIGEKWKNNPKAGHLQQMLSKCLLQ